MEKRKRYWNCIVCGRRRDPETGLCPTPEACDKLKGPHQRRRSSERQEVARLAEAARAEASIEGICEATGVPGTSWDRLNAAGAAETRANGRRFIEQAQAAGGAR